MAPRTDAPPCFALGTISGISERAPGAGFTRACRGDGVSRLLVRHRRNFSIPRARVPRLSALTVARAAQADCLSSDHIHLPDHHARLARVLRPELRAAPAPLPASP